MLNLTKIWHHFDSIYLKIVNMDMRQDRSEKRKRKVVSRPVLVRSVKPGHAISATYEKERSNNSLWRAA